MQSIVPIIIVSMYSKASWAKKYKDSKSVIVYLWIHLVRKVTWECKSDQVSKWIKKFHNISVQAVIYYPPRDTQIFIKISCKNKILIKKHFLLLDRLNFLWAQRRLTSKKFGEIKFLASNKQNADYFNQQLASNKMSTKLFIEKAFIIVRD